MKQVLICDCYAGFLLLNLVQLEIVLFDPPTAKTPP